MEKTSALPKNSMHPIKAFFLRLLGIAERPLGYFSPVGDQPFFEASQFPWTAELEKDWQIIREELKLILKDRDKIPAFQQISPSQRALTDDNDWQTFMLYGYGLKMETNCAKCPQTTAIVEKVPGMKTAFFSILAPGKHIPPHRGPYKGVLRCHLGLIVPEPKENCRIRVQEEYAHWEEGKVMLFDDSFDHEVWNNTNGRRVVLFLDFIRPLPQPLSFLNRLVINLIMLSPFVRKGLKNQKKWDKQIEEQEKKRRN